MPWEINNKVHLGQTVTPFESISKLFAINNSVGHWQCKKKKLKKQKNILKTGVSDADMARYIPEMLDLIFQGMIQKIFTIEQSAHLSYKDTRIKKTLDFELIQNKIYYINMKSVQVYFTLRFKKLINAAANLAAGLIPLNNFAHWVKEIDITKYGTNKASYQQQHSKKSKDPLNQIYAKTSANRHAKYDSKRYFI